jgi:hypothetical protein
LSPDAAMQLRASDIFRGFLSLKAISKDVCSSKSHNLGVILSPLKSNLISQSLLQVVIEIVHRLKISCGMMHGS